MNLTVALDARYLVAQDGSVWSQTGMGLEFWRRYLEVFDKVRIVARGMPVERVPEGSLAVTDANVTFHCIPDFHGPWQYLKRYMRVREAILAAVPVRGAVILRVGSQIANVLEPQLRQRDHPYALEVVGDPYEVFAPGVVDHPLRRFLRWNFTRKLRRQCLHAIGVAYVTRAALQKRYPAQFRAESISDIDLSAESILNRAAVTQYSSVELEHKFIVDLPRKPKLGKPFRIVTVGSLAQLYKGTDVLIEAIALCVRAGVDLTAVIVGDGKYRTELIARAERLGVASRVQFPGQIPAGEPVRKILDTADLFVLPSRTEGLPRALIEAMGRALPCIGSAVGGIPELLGADEMVPAGDAVALAEKIQEVLRDPSRLERLSLRNLEKAREFTGPELAQRRRRFYQYVRDYTLQYEAGRK